ncbi:Uncharacterized protein SCF082_LOCUS10854 [Durusdinium trenchii]|uniref:Uncharacterized protein n=1 Tax=Durusdinium trenchii TaxID=1381693 RepID=A0ABP0J924_9DINO
MANTTPFKQKVEERVLAMKKDEDDVQPPVKRQCSNYEKQMQKLPPGHWGDSHPASLVLDVMVSPDESTRALHCRQIEQWFHDFANWLGKPYLFKPSGQALDPSMNGETVKVPITCLRFDKPDDGYPCMEDWISTFESMLFGGVDLGREPLDGSMQTAGGTVKGWTRSSVVMTMLLAASEIDMTDPSRAEWLKPLVPVLEKCWMVPVHFTFDMDQTSRSFRNMTLSFRGSERQSPNTLQLSLRFSKLMEIREADGRHLPSMTAEERLREIVEEFNSSASRNIIRSHVDHHKWKECCFSTEQFRSQRWLLGTSPKSTSCPAELKKVLTVNEEAQSLHLQLTVQCFLDNGRRLRPSARPRVRWSTSTFDAHCDFTCVYASVLREARLLASFTEEKEKMILKAFFQKDYYQEIEATITSKLSTWKLQHLGLWTDMVEPPSVPIKVHSAAELMDIEDESQAAKFREIRAKLAQDCSAMTQHNTGVEECQRRSHVVKVMHEKSQMQIGKELAENLMEKCCRISLVTDKQALDPETEAVFRQTAATCKVGVTDVYSLLYVDCTKLGVLQQGEINHIGSMAERHLMRNPSRSALALIPPLLVGSDSAGTLRKDIRKLEDKLNAHKIELRSFTLNLNIDQLHKNRELPMGFVCYIGVLDSSLPLRGTAHRVVRGGVPEPESSVNVFCSSPLWLRQALPATAFPPALPEKEFVVPGEALLSHSERRNLTDLQETSQWLGGQAVPSAVLEHLCSHLKTPSAVVVLHPTTYDGCVELACLQHGYAAVGSSAVESYHKCSREVVKNHLLQVRLFHQHGTMFQS